MTREHWKLSDVELAEGIRNRRVFGLSITVRVRKSSKIGAPLQLVSRSVEQPRLRLTQLANQPGSGKFPITLQRGPPSHTLFRSKDCQSTPASISG